MPRNDTQVNAYQVAVTQEFAVHELRLDSVDENVCDGYATSETPGCEVGTPVEIKSCKEWVGSGRTRMRGRFSILANVSDSPHDRLIDLDGVYALIVYSILRSAPHNPLLVRRAFVVPAIDLDPLVPRYSSQYAKLNWKRVADRWPASEPSFEFDWVDRLCGGVVRSMPYIQGAIHELEGSTVGEEASEE